MRSEPLASVGLVTRNYPHQSHTCSERSNSSWESVLLESGQALSWENDPCPLQGNSLHCGSRKLWTFAGRVSGVRSGQQRESEGAGQSGWSWADQGTWGGAGEGSLVGVGGGQTLTLVGVRVISEHLVSGQPLYFTAGETGDQKHEVAFTSSRARW